MARRDVAGVRVGVILAEGPANESVSVGVDGNNTPSRKVSSSAAVEKCGSSFRHASKSDRMSTLMRWANLANPSSAANKISDEYRADASDDRTPDMDDVLVLRTRKYVTMTCCKTSVCCCGGVR